MGESSECQAASMIQQQDISHWYELLGNPVNIIGFLLCVAVAAYAQTITGFALGLVLLSAVTAFDLVPISDAANIAMVLSLVNAYSFFRADRRQRPWCMVRPALISSLCSVLIGVGLLLWLSANATQWLKIVLGIAIVGCACSLMLQRKPRKTLSSPTVFGMAGVLSGVLGGLFGTSGPPIVYLLYRQPLSGDVIRRALVLIFAGNACMRLMAVIVTGSFTGRALLLCVLSVPIVHFVTSFVAVRPPPVSAWTLRLAVMLLLAFSGILLVFSGLTAEFQS